MELKQNAGRDPEEAALGAKLLEELLRQRETLNRAIREAEDRYGVACYAALAAEAKDEEAFGRVMTQAVQHYTDTIMAALNPVNCADLSFILFALNTMAKLWSAEDPAAAHAARAIERSMSTSCITIMTN